MSKPLAVLVDGSGFIYRAYYAAPQLTDNKGRPIGAVFGFCSMLISSLEKHRSDLFCVVFDRGRDTFRSEIYPEYKANRAEIPEALKSQMPLFKEVCDAFGVPTVVKKGFEADDLIATYSMKLSDCGYEARIISSDKDLMQLITDDVHLFDPMKSKIIKANEVIEKYGVLPSQMIFLQALMGDASDNIPGVAGIGPKTAAKLIGEFKTLEAIYQNIDAVQLPKVREKLIACKESAFISLKLVALDRNVETDQNLDDLKISYNYERVADFFKSIGFKSLIKRLNSLRL